ncbi:MAG: amino acid permease [Gammaproteobacteria bacterium]|nr:amino acid permease [Gammaproteobacteria bacterium]MYK45708.1 amino acid permease [Gammaproteobacteria bacterium]
MPGHVREGQAVNIHWGRFDCCLGCRNALLAFRPGKRHDSIPIHRSPDQKISAPFSPRTALAVVIANMIGTGVFTSLGFQLLEIQSGFVILMLWFVGGITALCGALCYAELGAALPRSGGEYNFLSEIYHPGVGFVAGWVSASIGFAAPTALAAITFGTYLASVLPALSPRWLATVLIVGLAAAHATTRRTSGGTQRVFTYLKVLLIAAFCLLGWTLTDAPQDITFLPAPGDGALVVSGAFAVALIYVNYAYTGWNAATYVIDELDRRQTLSRVLLTGTAVVMALYLLLNYTFLYVAPVDALAGKLEIGYVAAQFIFGDTGAAIMGVALALLLVSTVSAMTLAGPRVLLVIGQDFDALRFLARTNAHDVPVVAIGLQSALAVTLVLTATFESILVFAGFTLGASTLFTVAGLFVLRWRHPGLERPYGVPLYPLPPLIFLALMGWTLTYLLVQRPMEGLAGVAILASGGAFYVASRRLSDRHGRDQTEPDAKV